jgi:hypothetical protein
MFVAVMAWGVVWRVAGWRLQRMSWLETFCFTFEGFWFKYAQIHLQSYFHT